MIVVILCGGLGTRIRGVNDDVPKPMITVGSEPILLHIMRFYASFGHREFVLCLGYRGDVIRRCFNASPDRQRSQHVEFNDTVTGKWSVLLAETGESSMTGSRVSQVREYVRNDDFLLTYGDGVSDVDINKLVDKHRELGSSMTITAVRPPARFGEVSFGEDGVATSFNEKPQASGGYISGGYFVCSPTLFDVLDDAASLVLEREPMQQLVAARRLGVHRHDGFWQCMDTHRDWELLNELALKGAAPWKRW